MIGVDKKGRGAVVVGDKKRVFHLTAELSLGVGSLHSGTINWFILVNHASDYIKLLPMALFRSKKKKKKSDRRGKGYHFLMC